MDDIDIKYTTVYRNLKKHFQNIRYKNDISIIIKIIHVIEASLILLENVESYIHRFSQNNETLNLDDIVFHNIDNFKEYIDSKENIKYENKKLNEIIGENRKIKKNDSLYIFNRMIDFITKFVSANIDFNNDLFQFDYTDQNDQSNQVFLSYAYVDKIYTYGLFKIFKDNGIYLYVDWMHNGLTKNIDMLKRKLNDAMKNSSQFLFLRTLNSEFGILGSGQIRQWCSWEIGNYYTKIKTEKFYTNIYKENQGSKPSSLLDTFQPLKYLHNGKMR
jgi:hypothetical protein